MRADGSANTASVLDIQGGTLAQVLAQGSLTTDLTTLDNQGRSWSPPAPPR